MKRILIRVEGDFDDAYRLALLVIGRALNEEGLTLYPMLIGDNAGINSFNQAQKVIETRVAGGVNALLITESFLNWECPENVLNCVLEQMELYLMLHGISVALLEGFDPHIKRTEYKVISGPSILNECSIDAKYRYNDEYCGEAFVLPHGILPLFTIRRRGS